MLEIISLIKNTLNSGIKSGKIKLDSSKVYLENIFINVLKLLKFVAKYKKSETKFEFKQTSK